MFSGIIESLGRVEAANFDAGKLMLQVATGFPDLTLGESVAINGTCLTVVEFDAQGLAAFYASAETLARTNMGALRQGGLVNLERAVSLSTRLSGHLVQGHVDGLAVITSVTPDGDSHVVWLEAPQSLAKFVAAKGSVALDGVSLTVNAVKGNAFSLNIIQHSWDVTGWGQAAVGQKMNMEIDMLARYVARLAAFDRD